jgi:hypothetical protein
MHKIVKHVSNKQPAVDKQPPIAALMIQKLQAKLEDYEH